MRGRLSLTKRDCAVSGKSRNAPAHLGGFKWDFAGKIALI